MIIQLCNDDNLNIIKITPDKGNDRVVPANYVQIESQQLADFMDGKLNMITFTARDNSGNRTSFILRRF